MSDTPRPATFHDRRAIGRGTYLITFHADDDEDLDYQPGHVFAFDCDDGNGKTLHHPYTIVTCDPEQRLFGFVFRHIPDGAMTEHLVQMQTGDQATFSGKYHEAIIDEIADGVSGFVGIATGSGIGPLYGFIKEHIDSFNKPIELYVGYRKDADVCLQEDLNELAAEYDHFSWQLSLSEPPSDWQGLRGHITTAVAGRLENINDKHFHLVGNGAMINEMRQALSDAGIAKEQVSTESFFNHRAEADKEKITAISEALAQSST